MMGMFSKPWASSAVRRADDVDAGLGLRNSSLGKEVERWVVEDLVLGLRGRAIHLFDDSAMTVRHVLAEADVSQDDEVGHGSLDGAGGSLHDAVIDPGSGGDFVPGLWQAEDNDGRDAEGVDLDAFLHRFINGEIENSGHGTDRFTNSLARTDEERVDESGGSKPGLPHKRA